MRVSAPLSRALAALALLSACGFVSRPASAAIVGDTVEVTSSVSAPKAVRYGFSSGANLSNNVSIPVEGGTSTVTQLPGSLFELKFP